MTAPDRPGAVSWDRPADFVDDPERPLLVPSPVAAERRGGESLTAQARLDQREA